MTQQTTALVARLRHRHDTMTVSRMDGFAISQDCGAAATEIERLKSALLECAADLEDEILARYPEPVHPSQARRKERDLETVRMARRIANG